MVHLLNLLAAIALLVWGTQIVRTGILRVFGENLRHMLAVGMSSRPKALIAGLGVTSLIQSSTATCLIVTSFLGRALVPLAAALAVMLGADMGTSLMAVVFSFDLSWLSPLLIFGGVVAFISREKTTTGRLGRVAIGLGLILLNRLLDGLDGAVARATHPTDFGGFLDIVADFVFYIAVPIGFAMAQPTNQLPALWLVGSFALTGTSFLAFATLAAKRGIETGAHGRIRQGQRDRDLDDRLHQWIW